MAPLLGQCNGGIAHAAGRPGTGSDVLGFDDEMSRDHDWGVRLTLLVEPAGLDGLSDYLDAHLPDDVHGHPTRFPLSNDPTIRHRIDIDTAERCTAACLGFDATSRIDTLEWLATSSQSVLELTAGSVFADTIGTLTEIRRRLRWYPDDVWRYVVATSWSRLAEELPLMSRAGIRGDEVGASIIAARLAGVAMRLGFQLERIWAPYPKWFGAAFTGLPRASRVRRRARSDVACALLAGTSTSPCGGVRTPLRRPTLDSATDCSRPGARTVPRSAVLHRATSDDRCPHATRHRCRHWQRRPMVRQRCGAHGTAAAPGCDQSSP